MFPVLKWLLFCGVLLGSPLVTGHAGLLTEDRSRGGLDRPHAGFLVPELQPITLIAPGILFPVPKWLLSFTGQVELRVIGLLADWFFVELYYHIVLFDKF